jgi:hypothetical protein
MDADCTSWLPRDPCLSATLIIFPFITQITSIIAQTCAHSLPNKRIFKNFLPKVLQSAGARVIPNTAVFRTDAYIHRKFPNIRAYSQKISEQTCIFTEKDLFSCDFGVVFGIWRWILTFVRNLAADWIIPVNYYELLCLSAIRSVWWRNRRHGWL